jgi:AcrR family transcriptional regulator
VNAMPVRTVRRDAARNQELVVRAAREVISELGTDASMEQVASRAGVGVGTVYRHFANKEALIDELVRLYLDQLVTQARTDLARGDGTGLENFLRALGWSFVEHIGYAEKLAGHTPSDRAAVLHGLIADLLAQAQQHGRIGAWATVGDLRTTTWGRGGSWRRPPQWPPAPGNGSSTSSWPASAWPCRRATEPP